MKVYLGEGIWWKLSPSAQLDRARDACERERDRRYRASFRPRARSVHDFAS